MLENLNLVVKLNLNKEKIIACPEIELNLICKSLPNKTIVIGNLEIEFYKLIIDKYNAYSLSRRRERRLSSRKRKQRQPQNGETMKKL